MRLDSVAFFCIRKLFLYLSEPKKKMMKKLYIFALLALVSVSCSKGNDCDDVLDIKPSKSVDEWYIRISYLYSLPNNGYLNFYCEDENGREWELVQGSVLGALFRSKGAKIGYLGFDYNPGGYITHSYDMSFVRPLQGDLNLYNVVFSFDPYEMGFRPDYSISIIEFNSFEN